MIEELRAGNPEALNVVREYILTSLRFLMKNHPDLEDAVQDSMVRILKNLHQFRGESNVLTWSARIARNVGLRYLTKRQHSAVSSEILEDLVETPAEESRAVVVDRKMSEVRSAWGVLDDTQRTTLEGMLEGKTARQQAEEMGVDTMHVYYVRRQAQSAIRKALAVE